MSQKLSKCIRFGCPKCIEDLADIDIRYNHVLVLDDLMLQAIDSVTVSKLSTQVRHFNTSIILILQNTSPKGKLNANIW